MDIGILAIFIGIVVATYNLIIYLRANRKRSRKYVLKALGTSLVLGLLAYAVVVNIDFSKEGSIAGEYETEESIASDYTTEDKVPTEYESISESVTESESGEEAEYKYIFRSEQLLLDHYEKHGIYMKYKNPEQYLKGANRVIADKDTLHAIEAEDGDDVYYLEKTNEFVVVSKDGYIRTYFCPEDGIDYFHRQSE